MTFKDLNLNNSLLSAIADLGFVKPTTIQHKVYAPIMAGKDVLGIAQTGTGKTFAYLMPIMRQWAYNKQRKPEVLILVPTRELVAQVVEEVIKISKYSNLEVVGAYGGTNIKTQILAINNGADLVVATPGRLLDLILNGTIQTKHIKKVVIDEVDEMLNLGFRTQLKNILDLLPIKRQNLLFSATITDEVEVLIEDNFNFPLKVEAAPTGTPLKNIAQIGYNIANFNTKLNFLEHLLETDKTMSKVLIFAGSKRLADDVHERLERSFASELAVIHSNKAQNTRFQTVEQFENGDCRILIATDIIARGLDVTAVSHVINMDVPMVPENYMHRIGRTGRADMKGTALTFITKTDKENKLKVEELMGKKIPMKKMPEEVVTSTELTLDEQPKINMKTIEIRQPKVVAKGKAHQDKKDKNKKVNIKVSRSDAKKKKYGKSYAKEYRN
jgi:ATP-dependent RNA helicase RhlE